MIPKTFQLCGRKWSVKHILPDEAYWPAREAKGYTDSDRATIFLIYRPAESDDYRLLTFFHELLHAIWFSRGKGYGDEPHDEEEIESIALLWHQYEKSKSGELNL